uniref:Dystrophin n=1 Tax=Rhabditophanes sp. KR3021 TaxID=114890 RepID=A0AC35U142_9BILA
MLFSGGAAGSSKPKKEEKKEKKSEKSERFEIQEQVFCKWAKWLLPDSTVETIKDLADPKFLIKFAEFISNKHIIPSNIRYEDIDRVFRTLFPDEEDKIYQVSIHEVMENVSKTVLSMIWQLIQVYWKKAAPEEMRHLKLSDSIKNWCLEACGHSDQLMISDFTSSWRDGMALNALLHSYDASLVDMDQIRNLKGEERLEHALNTAKYKLGVPKLLSPKDFHSEFLDNRSVVVYLMTLYVCLVTDTTKLNLEKEEIKKKHSVASVEEATKPPSAQAHLQLEQQLPPPLAEQPSFQQSFQQNPAETPLTPTSVQGEGQGEGQAIRSRKSSSSSQKSVSKKRQKKYEEQLKEYEQCLEQVLAWLLEAEEELNTAGQVNNTDVEILKNQFREHESFMKSMMKSQDSVGKVLARGQHLSQKLEEEQSTVVISQLLIVNQRWETVREQAMERQTDLQRNLNNLQIKQLDAITQWFDQVESDIKRQGPLAGEVEDIESQLKEHAALNEAIERQQNSIEKLSTFVAVVDVDNEPGEGAKYEKLDKRLQLIGERWSKIGVWQEARGNDLDGLVELQKEHTNEHDKLKEWLRSKEEMLGILRSVHHLETDQEIEEQLQFLQNIETDLEDKHSSFVKLSQLCMELVARYDKSNGLVANKIRQDLDVLTSRWDNIVTRLEEHNQMLMRTGRTDASNSDYPSSTNETEPSGCEPAATTIQFPSMESTFALKARNEGDHEVELVNDFVSLVGEMNDEIQPLYDWQRSFKLAVTADNMATLLQFCNKKLKEIKVAEGKVGRLQEKLDEVHQMNISAQNVQIMNDVFENFMKKWGLIVKAIAEALEELTVKNKEIEGSLNMAQGLGDWLSKVEVVLVDITKIQDAKQRLQRLKKIADQLDNQEKNLVEIQKTLPNSDKVKRLQQRMISILTAIQKCEQHESKATMDEWLTKMEQNLKRGDLTPGNVLELNEELKRVERLVLEILETKQRNADNGQLCEIIDKLVKGAEAKKNNIIDSINKTTLAFHKYEKAMEMGRQLRSELEVVKENDDGLKELELLFKNLRDKVQSEVQIKNEATHLLDDLISIAVKTKHSQKKEISSDAKGKIKLLDDYWNNLDFEIDEHINCLKKEQRKICETEFKNQKDLVDKLEKCVNASSDASDAEELSEYLDQLEHLIDKIKKVSSQLEVPSDSTTFKTEIEAFIVKRETVIGSANRRITTLKNAVTSCDNYENQLCKFQNWCMNVGHILEKRISDDVYASSVPHEYRQIAKEFNDNQLFLKELDTFIEKSKSQFQSNDRLRVLFEHSTKQLNELRTKFEEFKRPVMFNDAINKILRRLGEIENTVDDLFGCDVESVEYNLKHCNHLIAELTQISHQLKDLEAKKSYLNESDSLNVTEANGLDEKFEYGKSGCKNIGLLCEQMSRKLEKCKEYYDKFEIENKAFNASLLQTLHHLIRENGFTLKDKISPAGLESLLRMFNDKCEKAENSEDDFDKLLAKTNKYKERLFGVLDDLEEIEDADSMARALNNNRDLKNKYNDKVNILMDMRPDHTLQLLDELNVINHRWNGFENKLDEDDIEVPSKILRCNSASDEEGIVSVAMEFTAPPNLAQNKQHPPTQLSSTFKEKVNKLHGVFKGAEDNLDFKKYPIRDVNDWKERINNFQEWLDEWNPSVNEVLVEGRLLADNGRSELDVADALGKLDDVVEISTNIKEKLEENQEKMSQLIKDWDSYDKAMDLLTSQVDRLKEEVIEDIGGAKKVQQTLIEQVKEMENLNSIWFKIQRLLPGNEEGISEERRMKPLKKEIFLIEEKIKVLLKKEREASVEGGEKEMKKSEVDCISSGSYGNSLEMDVMESDEEKSMHLTSHLAPNGSIAKLYNSLEAIEEYFKRPEILPFDGLEEKSVKLQAIAVQLGESEGFVEANQMTMDLGESDDCMKRIKEIKPLLEGRKRQIAERSGTLLLLKGILTQTDNVIKNQLTCVVQRNEGRQKTPDLNELEEEQNECEGILAKSAVLLHQAENKLNPVLEKLSEKDKQQLKEQLNNLKNDFICCEKIVKNKRAKLESRLCDETKLKEVLDALEFWCEESEANLHTIPNPLSEVELTRSRNSIEQKCNEYEDRFANFHSIESLKNRFIALDSVDPDLKHKMRRDVSAMGAKITDLKLDLRSCLSHLETAINDCKDYWVQFNEIKDWLEGVEKLLERADNAKIYTPNVLEFIKYQKEAKEFVGAKMKDLLVRWIEFRPRLPQSWIDELNENNFDDLQLRYNMTMEALNTFVTIHASDPEESEEKEEEKYHQLLSSISEVDENKSNKTAVSSEQLYASLKKKETQFIELPLTNSSISSTLTAKPDSIQRKLSVREMAMHDTLMNIKHWLDETERDASATVEIVDQAKQRELVDKIQNMIDELKIRQLEALRIFDTSGDAEVRQKAEFSQSEIVRILNQCQKRKCQLNQLIEESRHWGQLKSIIELWLTEGNEVLGAGGRVNELSEIALREQLSAVDAILTTSDEYKKKMMTMNKQSNELLDKYKRDEAHNISHLTSKLNTKWSKFIDNIRVRKAVLEASIRSRNDFQSALETFEKWLGEAEDKIKGLFECTEQTQILKSSVKRSELMGKQKEFEIGTTAHQQVITSLRQMGFKLIGGLEEEKEKASLRQKLEDLGERWQKIVKDGEIVKERIDSAQEESVKLTTNLSELLYWIEEQSSILMREQPIAGDLSSCIKQSCVIKDMTKQMEAKEILVNETIQLAHSFLLQHNLRPNLRTKSVFDKQELPFNEETEKGEREERRMGLKILADCEKLTTDWQMLKGRTGEWAKVVETSHSEFQDLDKAVAESLLALSGIEAEMEQRKAVHHLRLEQLKDGLADNGVIKRQIKEAQIHVDDMNDCTGRIRATDVVISNGLQAQITTVNQRYAKLKRDAAIRQTALENAFTDFGPSSEHFLIDSCVSPWQRAIYKHNLLPYYINHDTEVTQWDHPVMIDIMEQVQTFNQVKFSAYRTAMKLRALQKRLCLDLIEMPELDALFSRMPTTDVGDQCNVEQMVTTLVPIFEGMAKNCPQTMTNVPMGVDLVINLLLNIFDPCRNGFMRMTSFKVTLVVFCKATLEDKYRYLFSLITKNNGVDPKRLAILFHDLIQIPKYLGEAAAFGGSNIEPSVRSCFELSNFPPTLNIDNFMNWLKLEPQSLVWLPVMHRLASAEHAKHQSKCNVCKMFPIIGLRYRCLHCFNFDMCQNCFFSQRTAKNHKVIHPMQEYCSPTKSKDDMRDFGSMVRNKIRGLRPKVGYLPVVTIDEGKPIENRNIVPVNGATENIHQRIHMFAQKLGKKSNEEDTSDLRLKENDLDSSHTSTTNNNTKMDDSMILNWKREENGNRKGSEIKSPFQLLEQVEQMHKEELDQCLQKLQIENADLKREVIRKKEEMDLRSTPNINVVGRGSVGSSNYNTFGRYESRKRDESVARAEYNNMNTNTIDGSLPPVVPLHQQRYEGGYGSMSKRAGSAINTGLSQSYLSLGKGQQHKSLQSMGGSGMMNDEITLVEEAKAIRLQKHRLEQRTKVLEEQNKQLETQLERLKKMLTTSKNDINFDLPPQVDALSFDNRDLNVTTDDEENYDTSHRKNRMEALIGTCDELGRAMETLIYSVVASEATDDEEDDVLNGNNNQV